MSDAVHLLVYLFRGGEPPAAIAASSAIVEEKIVEIADQLAAANTKFDAVSGPCNNRHDNSPTVGALPHTDDRSLTWQGVTG